MSSNKTFLENSNLYSEVDDTEASQVTGGYTAILTKVGQVGQDNNQTMKTAENGTFVEITNKSDFSLSYQISYNDKSDKKVIEPEATDPFLVQPGSSALVTWDSDLTQEGPQNSSQTLELGY